MQNIDVCYMDLDGWKGGKKLTNKTQIKQKDDCFSSARGFFLTTADDILEETMNTYLPK